MEVEAVFYEQAQALLADGRSIPVTDWLDEWGEPCDPDDAIACVAGSDAVGWIAIPLEQFEEATIH